MDSQIDTTSGGSVAERLARLKLNRAAAEGSSSSPSIPNTPPPSYHAATTPALPSRPSAPPRPSPGLPVATASAAGYRPASATPPTLPQKRAPPPLPHRTHTTHNVAPAPRLKPKPEPVPEPVRERSLPPIFNVDLSNAKLPPKKPPAPPPPKEKVSIVSPRAERVIAPVPARATPSLPPRLPSRNSQTSTTSTSSIRTEPVAKQNGHAEPVAQIPPRRKLPPPPSEAPPPPRPRPPIKTEPPKPELDKVPPPINLSSRPAAISKISRPEDLRNIACLVCRDFTDADRHAARPSFDRTRVQSLKALGIALTEPFPDPVDKARAIFTWMHHNIAYDVVGFFGKCIKFGGPEDTLRTGAAVCQGYAELYKTLANAGGLECEVVSGFGKGYGYHGSTSKTPPPFKSNHAWNVVKLPEPFGWHTLDACWGAGSVSNPPPTYKKGFNPVMFTSAPHDFGLRHFPSEPKYQCVPRPVTWEEFIIEPEDPGPQTWDGFGEDGWSKTGITPWSRYIPAGRARIEIRKRCPHWRIKSNRTALLLIVFVGDRDRVPMREIDEAGTVAADIVVREGEKVMVGALTKIGDDDARGVTAEEFARSGCRGRGMAWGYFAGWNMNE